MRTLGMWGWNQQVEDDWRRLDAANCMPARVVEEQRGAYRVASGDGEVWAAIAGRLRFMRPGGPAVPAVGDWVAIRASGDATAVIHHILPRRSQFTRKVAGRKSVEQVVAANIDRALTVTSLNSELNARRLERYLARVWESGATPVIVLTKADLCGVEERARLIAEVQCVAMGVPTVLVSAISGEGMDELIAHLRPGETAALIGSSGVGKSTLVNRLLGGARQRVLEIREGDERGRHATTSRQLFALPNGALLIDTPGMRELQLYEGDAGLSQAFADVAELATKCRFSDCQHRGEPGCAVQAAIADGALEPARLENMHKLQRELDYQARRNDAALQSEERKKWRKIHQEVRKISRLKGR